MDEYFCIFKRDSVNELQRRVVVQRVNEVYSGLLKFGDEELTVRDVQSSLAKLQRKRSSLALWCARRDLPKDSPFQEVAEMLDDTAAALRDEITDSAEILEEMSQYGMTAWIDEEGNENKSYFELQAQPDHLNDVELACAKLFVGDLKLHVIFLQGSYYCTVADATATEQDLEDTKFPDISSRGSGFQIKHYESGLYRKFAIWQTLDETALNMRNILRERARRSVEGKAEEKSAPVEEHLHDEDDDEEEGHIEDVEHRSSESIAHIDDDYLWGKSKEAFGGSYTQTYLMLKGTDGSTARRALFRYGNWCYGGVLQMDQEVTLHEMPHVLRKFQRQQGLLAYWFEVQKLPDGLPFTAPMKHFAMTSAFLEEELAKAEGTLTKITEYHKSKGIEPWVDQENGRQFFELESTGDQPFYDDVEFMASKTYYHGVVVITIYFQGSFYLTLSPSVGDQPLLDMSFPDVESRGRALQIATYSHHEYSKLLLWESQRSVWETANRAVLEQRRQAALQKQKQRQQEVAAASNAAGSATTSAENNNAHRASGRADRSEETADTYSTVESNDSDIEDATTMGSSRTASQEHSEDTVVANDTEPIVESKLSNESKESRLESAAETSSISNDKQRSRNSMGSTSPSGGALRRGTLEQKMQGSAARAPHHLKPLGSHGGSSKLPALDQDLALDAPWDASGRPKELFNARKK
ncbi:Hypothetical Protein FCC1311_071992 [Hondaea fermentalgiana]|uniref:Uncharacterized protein n=1 Tax=Hondaea fermentalgiana TaxID=2315210 RepID=A0A2R5GML7_9STRA|nr:Hypothetical Protein FCC1311_071992 [Hondaea fermentalgiana]|eukprot:GBG30978.1 Hypothetical Protein FCC1311_071992 [Hondaea fermentalgiana]